MRVRNVVTGEVFHFTKAGYTATMFWWCEFRDWHKVWALLEGKLGV